MKNYRKTFVGSIIALLLGTSCCWMSGVAMWFGGASLITVIIQFIEDVQVQLLLISVVLVIFSIVLYQRTKFNRRIN